MTTLTELAAMLDAATGPDRELDQLIVTTLFPRGNCFAPNGDCLDWLDLHEPEITNSIDAALALVERLLPGWGWSVFRVGETCGATLYNAPDNELEPSISSHAPTAPIAILKALVAALTAKEADHG